MKRVENPLRERKNLHTVVSVESALYLSVSEAASLVGVSVPAVNARIASKKLTCTVLNGRKAVLRTEVDAWMAERVNRAMAVVKAAAALP